MLLMVLLAPWAAKAQETLTVYGDNTTTNQFVPIYGYYADSKSKCEFIIPSEKISAMNGSVISAMKFYLDHSENESWYSTINATFEVFVKEVEATTLSGFVGNSGATTVFNGTITIGLGESDLEIDIPFSSDYIYGGGNLLVGFYQTTATGYNRTWWTGEAQDTNTAWGGYVSSASAKQFLPKTTFTYEFITTPTITLPASATVTTGFTTELTATLMNVTGTPTITYSSDDESVATVSGSGTTATVTGVSAGTATITATMTYNATDYTATCDITVEDPSYCEPEFSSSSSTYSLYITNFTTDAGINNSTGFATGGYGDYYDTQTAEIEAGETLSFTVSGDTYYGSGYAIWVDWNKDYEFSSDERVAVTSSTTTSSWSGSFDVASTIPGGDYRMRVMMMYSSASPSDPCAASAYNFGEVEDYKLTVAAANPYQKPVNLHLTNLEATKATLAWEAPNTDVQSYKYQYREEGGTWNALTSTTALSAPLADLTANTTYEFQVQAIYAGNNESAFASKSFTTPCAAFPIDYEYGFEDESEFNCWEMLNDPSTRMGIRSNDYLNSSFSTTGIQYSHTGDNLFAFFYYDYPNTDPDYMTVISPELTGIVGGLHVEFYYTTAGSYGPETFAVGYSTTNKQLSSFTWGNEVISGDTDYQLFKANYPAETKYIAFQHRSDDKNWLLIDDFSFTEAPDCVEPSNIQTPNITTTGANLSWTVGGSESAWDIYVTDDVTDVPDELTTPTYAAVSSHTNYPISGLTSGTTYYVYLRSACDATTHSDWTMPYQFNTECETIPLPYSYDFEDDALPICYNTISSDAGWNIFYISDGDPQHGSKHLIMNCQTSNEYQLLVLPEVDANYPLDEYEITFYAKLSAGSGRTLAVGIMTDPDDESTFEQIGDEITPTTTYAQYKVKFNNYTGSGQYIAIVHYISSTGNTYIDNLEVNHLPACIEPDDLTVTAPTAHGATFGWTSNGSETEWHLYFGKDNTAPADDIDLGKVTVADSNPFTMTTGLDPETDYYVWVRANCGGTDGYSSWVGPETFTTGIACPAPTGLAYSEVTNHTAKLSWTGTSESYVLSVGTYDYTGTPVIGTILESDFEDNTMQGWTSYDEDGDGKGWSIYTSSYAHESSYCIGARYNGSAVPNNWLISPQIAFGGTLSFYAKRTNSGTGEKFQVYVSTTGTDISNFTAISEEISATSSYELYEYDLSSYSGSGYIAIKHTADANQYWLYVDDITITGPTYPIAWNTYNTTDTQKTVEGLDPETPYFAKVKGNCGSEGYSQETAVIKFTTDIACPAPTGLTASNPTSTSFDLQWTNGGAEDWVLAYKVDGAADFTELDLNVSDVTEEAGTISYTLSGLDPETDYIVKVRDNCEASYAGDGMSEWTAEVPYSTIAACSAMNPVVSDITHHNATVTWEGESASGFTVNYRVAAGEDALFEEGFENGLGSWTFTSMNVVNGIGGTGDYPAGILSAAAHSDSYGFRLSSYTKKSDGETYDQYLVSPELTVTGTLKFYAKKYSNTSADNLYVGYSTTTSDLDAFTWDVEALTLTGSWNEFTHALPTDVKYFAFHYFGDYAYYVCVDDIAITVPTSAGEWQTKAATGTTADLTGLTAGTKYDLKVVPNCDETLESATVQFTTISNNVKHFLTAGNWNDAANWLDGEMPSIDDEAVLFANANIFGDASAKKITFSGSSTPVLTIENGGTLQTNNNVTATVKKHIDGYGSEHTGEVIGYYLIANPLSSTVYYSNFGPTGLLTGNYDLYSWSYTASDGKEWRNYKASSFSLSTQTGYLYANESDVDLTFTGTVMANNTDVTKNLNYSSTGTYAFNGWNLVGNPFACNAYTKDATDNVAAFYRMNEAGNGFVAATGAIKPMEGIFVQATATSQSFKFTRTEPAAVFGNGQLSINLVQVVTNRDERQTTDNAIIRFDEGNDLEKFMFSDDNVKLYIPQDGIEYAVVKANNQGTIPVNLKVTKTGNYTISFSNENMNFAYLHLIDSFTGEDIDLLIDDSYTFMASVRDRENRFILVFNAFDDNIDSASDIFAYQNGDEIIVSGEGELQVYDVMGRYVATYNVNGSMRISASQFENAMYIFRLVGNGIKTQKIVVR